MDDVFVVIGLLLFGSLLFCLCCYKISNLLYMLYHIDDNLGCDEVDAAFAAAAADNKDFNFATNYAAASAAAASGNMPDVNETSLAKMGDPTALLLSDIVTASSVDHLDAPNHRPPPAYTRGGGLRGAGSVSSLSVGIQCGPEDMDLRSGSEACLIPMSPGHPLIHNRSKRVHVSNPDFHHTSAYDMAGYGQGHGHGHGHSHARSVLRPLQPRGYAQGRHEPRYGQNSRHEDDFGSLDRQHRQVHHHGSVENGLRSLWQPQVSHHHHHLNRSNRFTPSSVMTGNSRLSSRGSGAASGERSARRYGSIRVAECSFIEHGDESPPSLREPSPDQGNLYSHHHHHHATSTSSASQKMASSSNYRPSTSARVSTAFNPYSAYGDDDCYAQPRLPRPTSPPVGQGPGAGRRPSQSNPGYAHCNGPRSVGISEGGGDSGRPPPPPPPRDAIIPPPQNFEDFQQQQQQKKQQQQQQLASTGKSGSSSSAW